MRKETRHPDDSKTEDLSTDLLSGGNFILSFSISFILPIEISLALSARIAFAIFSPRCCCQM